MILFVVAANVLVYLVMVAVTGQFSWNAATLLTWGGNLGEWSLHGQPWRLLSAVFVHASIAHIGGNMILLLITGGILEGKVGSVKFLIYFLLAGLAGSVASAMGHPDVVSVGASGAIAGLLGIVLVMKLAGRAPEVSGSWMVQILVLNGIYSFAPDVDGLAHLGGFVVGLALGAYAAMSLPEAEMG